jgi:hypothetical protein
VDRELVVMITHAGLQSFNRRKERNSDELFSSYMVWVTSAAAEIDIEVGGSIRVCLYPLSFYKNWFLTITGGSQS